MADFKQAVEWIRDGKKVKRKEWRELLLVLDTGRIVFCSNEGIEYSNDRSNLFFQDYIASDWEIYDEKTPTQSENCKGALWFTTMGRIVLDDHPSESFCEPYDVKIMTKEELTKGIGMGEFNGRITKMFKEH